MSVLVTGGTGFIGRRLVERLLAERGAAEIVCLVKPSEAPAEAAALARFRQAGIRIIEGDLMKPGVSAEAPPAVRTVFHLAANIDTAATEAESRVNDLGTDYLLRWLKPVSRGARIMYASSVAVLDRAAPAAGPLDESSPCTPRTLYGLTKLRGEQVIKARAAEDGFSYTIARLATVYGPGSKPGGLFDLLFQMTERRTLPSRLDWPGRTSVIYVDDVGELLMGLADRPEAASETYSVAHPDAPTVGQLIREAGRVSGHPVRPWPVPGWVWSALRRLAWHPVVRAAVPASARQAYWRLTLIVDHGFWFDTRKLQAVWTRPMTDLETGLRRMVAARRHGPE